MLIYTICTILLGEVVSPPTMQHSKWTSWESQLDAPDNEGFMVQRIELFDFKIFRGRTPF